MSCPWAEKIALLVDDELTPAETASVGAHLAECSACRQAQTDFLQLRRELKDYELHPDAFAPQRALRKILATEDRPVWRRRVSVPVPVMAALLVLLTTLGLWLGSLRASRPPEATGGGRRLPTLSEPPAGVAPGGFDLTRFDRGERAALYKVELPPDGAARP